MFLFEIENKANIWGGFLKDAVNNEWLKHPKAAYIIHMSSDVKTKALGRTEHRPINVKLHDEPVMLTGKIRLHKGCRRL